MNLTTDPYREKEEVPTTVPRNIKQRSQKNQIKTKLQLCSVHGNSTLLLTSRSIVSYRIAPLIIHGPGFVIGRCGK